MALLYWRPFINDGHSQGLKKSQSLSSLTFNNNGKFGKCLELTNYLDLQISPLNIDVYEQSDTEVSYSLWVKIDKTYINNLIANGINGLLNSKSDKIIINRIIGFNNISTASGLYIDLSSGTSTQLTTSSQLDSMYFMIGLRHDSAYILQSFSFDLDQWYHLAITYDKLNNLKFYLNGELMFQDQISRHALNSTISNKKLVLNAEKYMGASTSTNNRICISLKEYFNDIRIYNHALSAEEVKEISKGLILHYHLSGENTVVVPPEYQQLEYLETNRGSVSAGGINTGIIPTNDFEYRFKYALMEFNSYRGPFGSNQDNDHKATRIICNNGSTTQVIIYFTSKSSGGGKTVSITTSTDEVIEGTISKQGYYLHNITTDTEKISNSSFADSGESSSATMRLFGSGGTFCNTKIYYFDTLNKTTGQFIQKLVPVKRLSDQKLGMYDLITNNFYFDTSTTASACYIAGPNITIAGTVYDSSGYSNNGTVVQSLTAAAGSPRYGVATNFSGSNGFTYDHFVTSDSKLNECTFSAWVKRTYTDTSSNKYIFYGPIEVYLYTTFVVQTSWNAQQEGSETSSPNTWRTAGTVPLNEWTHIVLTFKNGTFTCYINGGTYKGSSSRAPFIRGYRGSGSVGNSFIGGISDLRFYMTALSATEVKELYDSSMIVDSNGNMTPRGVS